MKFSHLWVCSWVHECHFYPNKHYIFSQYLILYEGTSSSWFLYSLFKYHICIKRTLDECEPSTEKFTFWIFLNRNRITSFVLKQCYSNIDNSCEQYARVWKCHLWWLNCFKIKTVVVIILSIWTLKSKYVYGLLQCTIRYSH